MHLALVLLFCCGLRRGEVVRLRIRAFDPQGNVLHIEGTKFHKSRLVPLSESVADEMRRYLALRRGRRIPDKPDAFLLLGSNSSRQRKRLQWGISGTELAAVMSGNFCLER